MLRCLAGFSFIAIAGMSFGVLADNRVQTRLISDFETARAGSTIRVGVQFEIPERSHIYWRNPGDSGLATGVEWMVDESVEVGTLRWPAPRQFSIEGLENEAYFGYMRRALLYSEIKVPDDAVLNASVVIRAKVYWLLCEDDGVCTPEDKELFISIRVQGESRLAYESTVFDRWAGEVPEATKSGRVEWTLESGLAMTVMPPKGTDILDSIGGRVLRFVPNEGGAWTGTRNDEGKVRFEPNYKGEKANGGVLVLPIRNRLSGEQFVHFLAVKAPDTP
ncbi:MAG: protein-disulfide reductase DsbD domain-containing protein [Candidatus Hydrogenedentota bacterium]